MGLASKLAAQSGQPPQQNQQYDQPAGSGLSSVPQPSSFLRLLQQAVAEKNLEIFYDTAKLESIASSIGPKLQGVAAAWRIPMKIAVDLCRLALYDSAVR